MHRNHKTPLDKGVPEYQMFPVGMWHMLAAVMLMVFCVGITLITFSKLVSGWFGEQTLMYLELGLLVVMVLLLATPTFFLSRGWSVCQRFLVWQNRVYVLLLAFAFSMLFVKGYYGMMLTALVGLILALLVSRLYRSKRYLDGVEHYRLIWAPQARRNRRTP